MLEACNLESEIVTFKQHSINAHLAIDIGFKPRAREIKTPLQTQYESLAFDYREFTPQGQIFLNDLVNSVMNKFSAVISDLEALSGEELVIYLMENSYLIEVYFRPVALCHVLKSAFHIKVFSALNVHKAELLKLLLVQNFKSRRDNFNLDLDCEYEEISIHFVKTLLKIATVFKVDNWITLEQILLPTTN